DHGKVKACGPGNWVAGFYPGTLFYLYQETKNAWTLEEGLRRVKLMDAEQYNTGTHDLGFMMYCSYGNLYKIKPDETVKEILVNSATSLSKRFNPSVGCIRSWGKINDSTEFRVIIDNMMNLELLFWAAKATGNRQFYDIAVKHANTTLKNHFRKDYSSYHVVVYDPKSGAIIKKQTAQGAADESAWARGQAWGLYGFTMCYRETKDAKYLQQAQRIAAFILNNPNLPKDKIPYWDFNAPGIPNTDRDASAGAVIASALIELAGYSNKSLSVTYRKAAKEILNSLSGPAYKAAPGQNGGFLLMHSVSSHPGNAEIDVALSYADYYYIEALKRLKDAGGSL
ncbi:MAG TPA: glycoside hydrolase family 88 protein, partial [Niabella sp.]